VDHLQEDDDFPVLASSTGDVEGSHMAIN